MQPPSFRAIALVLALLAGAVTERGLAQSPCETALADAQKDFQLGIFEEIPGRLGPCFRGRATRAQRLQAYTLLANTYLASDEQGPAREAVAAILRIDPDFAPDTPPRFVQLVEQVKRETATDRVVTASKTEESFRDTPATVWVVTSDDIARRGYQDLEAVLHDLPGFDFSRGNGELYSSVYLRGLASPFNDRFLLLIDGVEQNSLSEGVAHLSRQYSLSDVDRIEVVYGPVSAMYGPNALTGVIQVITKRPEGFLAKGQRFGFQVQGTRGSFQTTSGELALAGRTGSGNLAWSLTGRVFRSEEPDLSHLADWDYDYSAVDYKQLLRLEGDDALAFADEFTSSLLYEINENEDGSLTVELTDLGESLVREIDRRLLAANSVGFSDRTEDLSVHAQLRISDLSLGLLHWREDEGVTPWYTDSFLAGRQNGNSTAPRQTSLYLRYSRPTGKSSWFTLFTRYRNDGYDGHKTSFTRLETYAAGRVGLFDVAFTCEAEAQEFTGEISEFCLQTAFLRRVQFEQSSSELASEAKWVYHPSEALQAVAGVEARRGSIQRGRTNIQGGFVIPTARFDRTALGAYGQVSYRLARALSIVGSGRFDRSEGGNAEGRNAGFGNVFSPRLALIYTPSAFTFKALYSEAFTILEKEELAGGEPAKAESFEVSAGWQPADSLDLRLAAYRWESEELVIQAPPHGTDHTLGSTRVRGLLAGAGFQRGELKLWGNYTYTEPSATVPRVAARHRVNLGFDLLLRRRLDANLRLNYVGAREAPAPAGIGASWIAHAALTWRDVVPGSDLQLIANNLFDESYDDPGVPSEGGPLFAALFPQPGRTFFVRLQYRLPARISP